MAYAENASSWIGTLADARGRGYRSGQGLHRGDTVGSGRWRERRTPEEEDIGPGNNALSRNLSCITPPPQQPEPISSPSGWHFRPVGKNIKYVAGTEADAGRPVLGV